MQLISSKNQCLIALLFIFLIQNVSAEQEVNGQTDYRKIYIAGFVLDDRTGQGLADVDIVIEHKNRKILSMRTGQDGWFESLHSLNVPKEGLDVRVTLIKPGYKLAHWSEKYTWKFESRNLEYKLGRLPNLPPLYSYEEPVGYPLYGFIKKPDAQEGLELGLAGAKVTLYEEIGKPALDIAISRDSGYFTLYYNNSLRGVDKEVTLLVEHPDYNTEEYKLKAELDQRLGQQEEPIKILGLTERHFDIAWLLRIGMCAAASDESRKHELLCSHVNLWRLLELAVDGNFWQPSKGSEWNLYLSNYKTKETDVGALMFGASWKPGGVAQKEKIVLDFAIGKSEIEINRESKKVYRFPNIQFGASYYRKNPYESFATPHYRIGGTTYKDNLGWNHIVEISFGI